MSQKYRYRGSEKLKAWLKKAHPDLRDLLCEKLDTSLNTLRQYGVGRRNASATVAGRIEEATAEIAEEYPSAPEPLKRGDVCEACENCSYFQSCQN